MCPQYTINAFPAVQSRKYFSTGPRGFVQLAIYKTICASMETFILHGIKKIFSAIEIMFQISFL